MCAGLVVAFVGRMWDVLRLLACHAHPQEVAVLLVPLRRIVEAAAHTRGPVRQEALLVAAQLHFAESMPDPIVEVKVI